MTPTVGRIVHYVSHGTPVQADGSQAFTSECRAAIVTEVYGTQAFNEHGEPVGPRTCPDEGQHVNLAVLNPTGMFFNQAVPFDDSDRAGGSWHWPERVE